MKTTHKYLMTAMAAGAAVSCATDIERPELIGFGGSETKELTVSTDKVIMEGLHEENPAVTFIWGDWQLYVDNPEYSVPEGSVEAFLEMSPNADFSPMESTPVEGHEKTFSEKELNLILLDLGYDTPEAGTATEGTPLYVRIRYAVSDNIEYRYSRTVRILAAPYPLHLNRMDVVSRDDRTEVLASLYSPEENGIYSGYMTASDWLNFYLVERDETLWGSVPGSPYSMTTGETTFYNLWFPEEPIYSYYVTADTNEMEWSCEYINTFTLTSKTSVTSTGLKFDEASRSWSARVTTSGAETFMAAAVTTRYGNDCDTGINEDGNEYIIPSANTLQFDDILTIPEAGYWSVTIRLSGEKPEAVYVKDTESYLEVTDAGMTVMSRLFSSARDGMFRGFYYSAGTENFFFAAVDQETVYGASSIQGGLSSESDNAISGLQEGLYLLEVNLSDNTWTSTRINSLTAAGDNGLWTDLHYDEKLKIWTADLDIQAVGWGMQILIDGSWDNYFKSAGNGVLGYMEGGNIMAPGAGRYRLTVDLFDMSRLTYKFERL